MTLEDYARSYASHCWRKTMRPHLCWCVRNAANSNRAHPPREGAAVLSLSGSPRKFPDLSHAAAHNGEPA